jgi:hypothetical protein
MGMILTLPWDLPADQMPQRGDVLVLTPAPDSGVPAFERRVVVESVAPPSQWDTERRAWVIDAPTGQPAPAASTTLPGGG